jgi:hypothetical protein
MEKVIFNIGGVNIEMDKEAASKAIEAGETIELKTEDLITYKKDEFDTFKSNLANDEYIKGRLDSAEMLQKAVKEKTGFDFSVKVVKNEKNNVDFEATAEGFVNSISPLIEAKANIAPTEQVNDLKGKLTTLQTNYTTLETGFNDYKTTIVEKETRFKKDSAILAFMPDNLIVDKDIAMMALKTKAGLDVDNDGFALINGETSQDKLMQNIPLSKDIITDKLTTLGLIKAKEGGRGGGDDTGNGAATSYEKFIIEMESNKIPAGSENFQIEMNKRIKDKTLIM